MTEFDNNWYKYIEFWITNPLRFYFRKMAFLVIQQLISAIKKRNMLFMTLMEKN